MRDLLGVVLVMTVNPGFGAQSYIGAMEPKVAEVAAMLDGWGGGGLPASYDFERRLVGLRNVTMASEFHASHLEFEDFKGIEEAGPAGEALRKRLGAELNDKVGQMFRTEGVQIGYLAAKFAAPMASSLPSTVERTT